MRKPPSSLRAVLCTLPLAVAVRVPPTDSETTVSVEGGGGTYVSILRDCNGEVIEKDEHHFYDAAIEVAHWHRPYSDTRHSHPRRRCTWPGGSG